MDGRLDKRSYDEFEKSLEKWEPFEERAIKAFAKMYINTYGGEVNILDSGFRNVGLEKDVTKINTEPDFKLEISEGILKNKNIIVEVQCMEPDYNKFHIKKHKVDKAISNKSYFLHMSALDKENERFIMITSAKLEQITTKSLRNFNIVGFPGTVCSDFPSGKPAYRYLDTWFNWNYTRSGNKIIIE